MKILIKLTFLLISLALVECSPFCLIGIGCGSKDGPSTVKPKAWSNETIIGVCEDDDKLIYIDDTRLESNSSQLSGVIEIYIESNYSISCVKLIDQMQNQTGAEVLGLAEGGQGHKFIKINVEGKYGYGIHFKIFVWGNIIKAGIKDYVKKITN